MIATRNAPSVTNKNTRKSGQRTPRSGEDPPGISICHENQMQSLFLNGILDLTPGFMTQDKNRLLMCGTPGFIYLSSGVYFDAALRSGAV